MDAVLETTLKTRLLSQFRTSPNILALIEIVADPLQDTYDAMDFILGSLSIDEAEGEQLDMLGELIGVARPPLQETYIFTLVRLGEDQDPNYGFADDERPGGYLTTSDGLQDQSNPNDEMSDADFRYLIRQKASSYRKKMTRLNLYNYLLAFGARCKIDDDTTNVVTITMDRWDDYNEWQRNYIETRGFKPAGILVEFDENLVNGDSI